MVTAKLAAQASTLLSDGRVFTIGGSWNGGIFIKNGEIWSESGNWTLLPGCPVRSFLIQHLTPEAVSSNDRSCRSRVPVLAVQTTAI